MATNHELAALHTLADSMAERLSDEVARRIGLGHGPPNSDSPADLAALIALQQDLFDAREVTCALCRHQVTP